MVARRSGAPVKAPSYCALPLDCQRNGTLNGATEELREAVQELHQYLSDRMAPLMFTESMGILLEHPPALVADQIEGWAGHQRQADPTASSSDLLYHGVKKVFLMGEFDLMDRE